MARAKKGTPTSLNLWSLAQHFGMSVTATNKVEPTSAPHIRRCLKAGLVTVSADKKSLVLTDAGLVAMVSHHEAEAYLNRDNDRALGECAAHEDFFRNEIIERN